MRIKSIAFYVITQLLFSCATNAQNPNTEKSSDSLKTTNQTNKTGNYYPFNIGTTPGDFSVGVETESADVYATYNPIFVKYRYSGNGYSWEGHIKQILKELDPALLKHVNFDAEAGSFFAVCDSKESQIRFVEVLTPIFSDLKKLEEYIKKAKRFSVDD